MTVVYSASDLYAPLAGISMTSLLINNQDIGEIGIVILDNGISQENKARLTRTARRYGRDIRFVPLAESLSHAKINAQKWNISTFGRLFEASSLPEYDRVIHIDCDTVVCGSLKELWELDMSRAAAAGAPDCLSDAYKTNIGLLPEETYLNAGVLVLNLKLIRDKGYEERFRAYIDHHQHLTYVDQEVLNACIPENEKITLPLRCNSYSILHYVSYRHLKTLRHVRHMFTQAEYQAALDHPAILHFTGCFLEGTRPWITGNRHPQKAVFDLYRQASEWADMSPWPDTRSRAARWICAAVKAIPRWLLAPVVGCIHGIYIPKRDRMRRNRG